MKKFLVLINLSLLVLTSCKTTSHVKCDAYSINENNEEYDINKIMLENNKKFI
jgi:hypothetical protein